MVLTVYVYIRKGITDYAGAAPPYVGIINDTYKVYIIIYNIL